MLFVNISSFSAFNISVNNTLKLYESQALNEKLNLEGRTIIFFWKKLLAHEIFSSLVPGGYKIFFEKFAKPSVPPPTYLMYAPLIKLTTTIDIAGVNSKKKQDNPFALDFLTEFISFQI